jgi:hypothetical protein
MTRVFENRITSAGRQAMQDLIDHVAQSLGQTIETHGLESVEAEKLVLSLAAMYHRIEKYDKAEALVRDYVARNRKFHGNNSEEVACGLLFLSLTYPLMDRTEEAHEVQEEYGQVQDPTIPGLQIMLEALYELATSYQGQNDPKSRQRAFLTALVTLSWLVTVYEKDSPPDFMERHCQVFRSFGFRGYSWEWLVRRCNIFHNDVLGLISVLDEERMFVLDPTASKEAPVAYNVPIRFEWDDGAIGRGYEIAGVREEHWKTSEGFSNKFPVIMAEGELSMRVDAFWRRAAAA